MADGLLILGTVYSIHLSTAEQVSGVAIALLGLGTWLLAFQGAGEAALQGFDETVGSEGPAGTGVAAQQLVETFVLALAGESRPVGDQVQHRSHSDQSIVAPGKVGCSARPRPILRAAAKPCSHRVTFDVPRSREQVLLIQDEGVEALLPEMPLLTLTEVDYTSVSAMGFPGRVA